MSTDNSAHEAATALVREYVKQGQGLESTMKLYVDTAGQYDEMLKTHDFRGPEILGQAVKELMDGRTDVKVIDVCAGTGLSGLALQSAGFKNIDALDGCQAMLDTAHKKGVYGKLFCEMIGEEDLNIPQQSYDVATFSGAFQENHLRSSAFRRIIPLVKPGGFIVNVMRQSVVNAPWYGEGLEVYMAQLEQEGLWRRVSHRVVEEYIGTGSGFMSGVIHVYQVL